MPMIMDAQVGTYPDEGVAATKPAIVPEQNPTMVHFFSSLKSRRHQTIPPIAAQMKEFHAATMARRFAPKAEPALNLVLVGI